MEVTFWATEEGTVQSEWSIEVPDECQDVRQFIKDHFDEEATLQGEWGHNLTVDLDSLEIIEDEEIVEDEE